MKLWNTYLFKIINKFFLSITFFTSLYAWSHAIHRVVVEDVEEQLHPEIMHKLQHIMGTQSLASWAAWADTQTIYPKAWHFIAWEAIDADCGENDHNIACALDGLIGNTALFKEIPMQHRIALLIHLVVDAHQPLHVDTPGFINPKCYVRYKKPMQLHALIDRSIQGKQLIQLKKILRKKRNTYHITDSSVRQWLKENKPYWDSIYPQYHGDVPYYCIKGYKNIPSISRETMQTISYLMIDRLALSSHRLLHLLHNVLLETE